MNGPMGPVQFGPGGGGQRVNLIRQMFGDLMGGQLNPHQLTNLAAGRNPGGFHGHFAQAHLSPAQRRLIGVLAQQGMFTDPEGDQGAPIGQPQDFRHMLAAVGGPLIGRANFPHQGKPDFGNIQMGGPGHHFMGRPGIPLGHSPGGPPHRSGSNNFQSLRKALVAKALMR